MSEQFNAVWKPLTMGDFQDRLKELNDLVDLLRAQMRDQNMRTRDRFAMAALTGILANPQAAQMSEDVLSDCQRALIYADTMMERRIAPPPRVVK